MSDKRLIVAEKSSTHQNQIPQDVVQDESEITGKVDNSASVGSRSTRNDKTSVQEHGGPKGPEPTRYGDWEQNGRCTDF